jgi:hypothetical protein
LTDTFARRVFLIAGIWGLLIMPPQYFLEGRIGRLTPPPITHPEYFYGFIGVTIAWQVAFLLISRDPIRYRPMMLVAVLEKAGFGPAMIVLYMLGRVNLEMLGAGILDMTIGAFFVAAFLRTPRVGPGEPR